MIVPALKVSLLSQNQIFLKKLNDLFLFATIFRNLVQLNIVINEISVMK